MGQRNSAASRSRLKKLAALAKAQTEGMTFDRDHVRALREALAWALREARCDADCFGPHTREWEAWQSWCQEILAWLDKEIAR